MSKQAADRASRLLYSHSSLELPPCFHRQHEPRSSCIHTIGCPCLPWHCHLHLAEARNKCFIAIKTKDVVNIYISIHGYVQLFFLQELLQRCHMGLHLWLQLHQHRQLHLLLYARLSTQ